MLELLKIVGAVLGIVAFAWKLRDHFASYLRPVKGSDPLLSRKADQLQDSRPDPSLCSRPEPGLCSAPNVSTVLVLVPFANCIRNNPHRYA